MKETTVGPGDDRKEVEGTLREEVESLERILDQHERTITVLRRDVDLYNRSIGWRLQQRLIPWRKSMLAVPGLRQIYRACYRALEIWIDEGFLKIFGRMGDKVSLAFRGKSVLVEERDGAPPRIEDQYQSWIEHRGIPPTAATMRAAVEHLAHRPLISVLVALDAIEPRRLDRALANLRAQGYERWELCVTVPQGGHALQAALDQALATEPRIRVASGAQDSSSYADAFRVASGDFVAVLNPDDDLAPEALFELVKRLNDRPDADIVYSDEDWLSIGGRREDPLFKPDWSPDLLLSTNYLEHIGIFRRQLVEQAGGFRVQSGRGQVYDLVLRLTERTDRIAHAPKILYHNRRQPGTPDAVLTRQAASRDESRVLVEALGRRGTTGRSSIVFARRGPRCYVTRFDLKQQPLVSIIIPTRDKVKLLETTLEGLSHRTDYRRFEVIIVDNESTDPAAVKYLESLEKPHTVLRWSKPFNYSAINNFGVQHARGEQLLFLNNDVEVIHPDWLTAMLEHAQRPEVGAVGARLLYGDGRIQHAGVVVGINRVAANAFRSWPGEVIGNLRLADLTRNCSAVTGACMMVPRRVFDEVGGFDEALRVVLNDVDLCLKIRERGYLVVYTPDALLYHYEGSSRGRLHPPPDEKVFERRWSDFLDRGDPYYNPNLTDKHDDWRLKVDLDS